MSAPVNGTVPDPSLVPASNETNPSPPAPVAKGPPPAESVAPAASDNPPPPAPPADSPPSKSEPNAPPGDSSSTPPPKPSEEDSSPPAPEPKPRDPPPVSAPPPQPSNDPPVQPLPPPSPSLSPPRSSISPAPSPPNGASPAIPVQTPPPSPFPPESQQPPPGSPPGETVSPPPPVQQPPSPQSPSGAIFFVPPPRSPIKPSPPGKSTNSSSSSSVSSGHKSTKSSSKSDQKSNDGNGIIEITIAGVAIVVLFAFVFFCVRKNRKKKQEKNHTGTYKPSGGGFSVKSDGYYYRQAGLASSSPNDPYYTPSPSPAGNGMRNNGGYGYQPGLPDASPIGNSKSCFAYEELMEITDGFSHENLLGQGGFGCVYKGRLQDGREVAVKQLKAGGGQGEREFMAEVEIISRVHHRHLVSLEGYCMSENQRLLVYEFVPNNTLEHHLHGNGLPPMNWANRVKIAIGSAKGLAYLHEDCHPRIIHRDIKSANILLDNSFEAKVADFGLAKLSNDSNTHISTRVMGTFGYLAPEYASSGKLTDKSDVFSFGVVLLELVTGRKPVDASQPLGEESLVEWARPVLVHALETGNITQLVDPRLGNKFVEGEMLRMIETAAACVRHSAPKRPRMVQVVRALDSEGETPDLSNGVKYGQSAIFEGQNTSIERFRRLAFGSGECSSEYSPSGEFDQRSYAYGSEHSHSREGAYRQPNSSWNSGEHPPSYPTSGESGIRVMNQRDSARGDNFHAGFGSHQ